MAFRGIFLVIMLYIICFCMGKTFFRIMKRDCQDIFECTAYGMIFILFTFQLICFPFILAGGHFNLLYYIFLSVMAISVLCGGVCTFRERRQKHSIEKNVLFFIFIFLLILQVFVISYMHFESTDDGYYIAVSNAAIEQNIIELNDTVVYGGNDYFADACTRPEVASWELLIAFFSKLFHVHPAVVAHTFLPIVLVPLYYMAMREIFKKITANSKECYLCLIITVFMTTFCGNGYLISSYLFVGTWIGKALLTHFILPLLLSNCIDIIKGDIKAHVWIKIGCISVAGVAATANGIYTVPLYCLSLAVPYLIYLGVHKRFTYLFKILKYMVFSMAGIIFFGVYAVLQVMQSGNRWAENYSPVSLSNICRRAFRENMVYTILFVLAIVLMLVFEKQKEWKVLLVGQTLFIAIVFLNPLSAEYLAVYVTGTPVYWRMILLFPLWVAIPMGAVYCCRHIKRKVFPVLICLIALGMIAKYGSATVRSIYTQHQNLYMIRQDILEVVQSFDLSEKKMITVLANQKDNKFFRQYSSWFDVVVGRNDQIVMDERGEEYMTMYNNVFENHAVDEETNILLDKFGVEYIVTEQGLERTDGVKLDRMINTFYIYSVE